MVDGLWDREDGGGCGGGGGFRSEWAFCRDGDGVLVRGG